MNSTTETDQGTAKPGTLVLGLGNDLLTDDSIGLQVAALLRQRLAGQPSITVSETAEMGLSLLDIISGFDRLILVDAVQTGRATPGFVHRLDAADLAALPAVAPHFLGVGEALALGRKLGLQLPERVTIFAIEVEDVFTVGTQLSPALRAALPSIVAEIAGQVLTAPTPRSGQC